MKILRYNELINEEYVEKPEYQIKTFFTEFEKNIKYYFEEGAFATDDIELIDIKQINTNSIEKNLMFDFQDNEFYYKVIVIINITELNEDKIEDCYVKVKKYNSESELLRTYGENIKIDELDEDKIIELFSKLDENSKSLINNDKTLSDEDSNLDNSNLV